MENIKRYLTVALRRALRFPRVPNLVSTNDTRSEPVSSPQADPVDPDFTEDLVAFARTLDKLAAGGAWGAYEYGLRAALRQRITVTSAFGFHQVQAS